MKHLDYVDFLEDKIGYRITRCYKVLMLRTEGWTINEVAKYFKVTPERIRQVESMAIRKVMRRYNLEYYKKYA